MSLEAAPAPAPSPALAPRSVLATSVFNVDVDALQPYQTGIAGIRTHLHAPLIAALTGSDHS